MSTAIIEKPEPKLAELRFSVTEETIKTTIAKFEGLTINGIDDEEGFEKVNRARLDCVKARNTIEDERLAAGREYRAQIKIVDSAAEKLQKFLAPTETRLKNLVNGIEAQREEIRQQKIDIRNQIRKSKLDAVGGAHIPQVYREWTDEAFETFLAEAAEFNRAKKEREERESKIAEENRIEQKRLADLAAEQKRQSDELAERQRKMDEQQAALDAAQKKIDDSKAEESRKAIAAAEQGQVFADKYNGISGAISLHESLTVSPQVNRTLGSVIAKPSTGATLRRDTPVHQALREGDRESIVRYLKRVEAIELPDLTRAANDKYQDQILTAFRVFESNLMDIADQICPVEMDASIDKR